MIKEERLNLESKPVEEELADSYWKYYENHDCPIPLGTTGIMRICISWIVKYSRFYYDGKWPNKTQEEFNQYYNSFYEDILSREMSAYDVYKKYYTCHMTPELIKKLAEIISVTKNYAPTMSRLEMKFK